MTHDEYLIQYHYDLAPAWKLPTGIDRLFPFEEAGTRAATETFYRKYYHDNHPRTVIYGINPGRFGAGVTGIPFVDPILLAEKYGIANDLEKRHELSSLLVYDWIEEMGGPDVFFSQYLITSVSPLGFVKDGKNINYYDQKDLLQCTEPYITTHIQQFSDRFGIHECAYSLGKGQNMKHLQRLNDQYQWYDQIIALPHPRWIMQYQRKHKAKHLQTMKMLLKSPA